MIDAANDRWTDRSVEEVTIEANPSGRETPDWDGLRVAGVDRISLGAQSLRDEDLHALARGHTAAEAREAYAAARAAGFENISVDLIYGIPGQSLDDWRAGLSAALELGPDHLSCYALQLALDPDEWAAPPRTGAQRWRGQMAERQDEELAADQYRVAEEELGRAGYRHYEISSWALPGRESRHNGAYWDRRAYTGIGAGAHSYDGAATRSWNTRDLDTYLDAVDAGRRPADGEQLGEETRAFEAIALGLRRVDGMSRRRFASEFGVDPVERYREAVDDGVTAGTLAVEHDALRLTPRGRLLASEVLIGFAGGTAVSAAT